MSLLERPVRSAWVLLSALFSLACVACGEEDAIPVRPAETHAVPAPARALAQTSGQKALGLMRAQARASLHYAVTAGSKQAPLGYTARQPHQHFSSRFDAHGVRLHLDAALPG